MLRFISLDGAYQTYNHIKIITRVFAKSIKQIVGVIPEITIMVGLCRQNITEENL